MDTTDHRKKVVKVSFWRCIHRKITSFLPLRKLDAMVSKKHTAVCFSQFIVEKIAETKYVSLGEATPGKL
jgi:hypothetical protein